MAGRFPLFADNHIRQPLVDGLLRQGWDVVRSVDIFKEGEDDAVLFAWTAEQGRVFLTNDKGIHRIAKQWLQAGRTGFRMIFWKQLHHQRMSEGDFLARLESMAQEAELCRYPIRYIKPD
jgi:hypothetical protein